MNLLASLFAQRPKGGSDTSFGFPCRERVRPLRQGDEALATEHEDKE